MHPKAPSLITGRFFGSCKSGLWVALGGCEEGMLYVSKELSGM